MLDKENATEEKKLPVDSFCNVENDIEHIKSRINLSKRYFLQDLFAK